ncbi:hypothetical protein CAUPRSCDRAFT_12950 [Caulochytrium protostelioides]|uniref:F-BAR domain-containing protein n=1 Tax=Caulochytrium protostelioides TaxID=1555241 RepID=A0A4P9WVY7_9FUNG|nr:hypothetical protein CAUPRSCDRAFT_12950 [Caulochytrium protostelioides]
MQTWLQVLNQTEAVAAGHEKATEEFDNNFRKQVKRQSEENDKAHKKQFDDIRKAHAELLRIQDNVVKLHERYDTCVKSMETARAAYEKANNDQNATKKDVERLRVESEKRALATQEARNAYTAGIESANAKKDQHFREQLPALLDAVQSSDEQNRIAFLKGMFEKWATLFNSLTPLNEQAWSAVQQAAGCISPTYDSNLLVKMCKTVRGQGRRGDADARWDEPDLPGQRRRPG